MPLDGSASGEAPELQSATIATAPRAGDWLMDDDAMAAFGLSRSGDDEDPAPQSCPAPRQPAAGPAAKTGGSEAMWRHAMGERSTAVGTLARVRAPKGVRLRSRPAPGAPELGVLRFDELISVERRTEHGWCWVIPTGPLAGIPGFCEEQHLSLDPPEPTAHLHHVEPGDSLRELAARHYGKQLRDGRDARLYVQALYEANKNHKGVYLTEVKLDSLETLHRWEDDERTLEIFQGAKVREGHAIWMPSEAFIEQLRASGAIAGGSSGFSQAWSGAVAAVGHVASAATYGSAFLVGLLEGAWSSVVDLFEGAAEMLELVGTLALRLLTGNPGAIKAMLLGWVDKLEVAWAGRDKLADDFMKKWQSDDAWTRGNFQGEVLGWVMMTALLILVTSGASSVAAATGKWASVLRVLGAAEALGDVVTYASKLGRLPGKAIAFVRRRFGKAASKAAEEVGDAAKATDELEDPSKRVEPASGATAVEELSSVDLPSVSSRAAKGGYGSWGGRTFDLSASGGPVRSLSTDKIRVTQRGVEVVEAHLNRFGPDVANENMLRRLREIVAGRATPTQVDLNFYSHELREYVRYRRLGFAKGSGEDYDLWNNTHSATLADYGLVEAAGVLYHPDALP